MVGNTRLYIALSASISQNALFWSLDTNVHGLIDVSHRFKFHDVRHLASVVESRERKNLHAARSIQSKFTELIYKHFTTGSYNSIESYMQAVVSSSSIIESEAQQSKLLRKFHFYRAFDTFYYWHLENADYNSAATISNFVQNRDKFFGDIFKQLGSAIRDVDEENTNLNDFVDTVRNIFAVDDVILWKFNPTSSFMTDVASTVTGKNINAGIQKGLIAESIKSRRTIYYPNLRNVPNYLDLVQHSEVVQERGWKGSIVCPLHFSKNLVGVIGLYSKHDLIFSKIEISLILYLLANLSKRMSRELFGSTGESDRNSDFSIEKLQRLAPTIYAGTKNSYRLHSIKNKLKHLGDVLDAIQPIIPHKKESFGIDYREKVSVLHTQVGLAYEELETCLQIGSDKLIDKHKSVRIHSIVDEIRKMLINHPSVKDITRSLVVKYNRDATIVGDSVSLENAIYNVVENSFYFLDKSFFSKRESLIEVEFDQQETMLVISITDNAYGMSNEEFDNCKALYYSGETKSGSGVGLWMTERIMHEHFGEIEIVSSDFEGTNIKLLLPIEDSGDLKKQDKYSKLLTIPRPASKSK